MALINYLAKNRNARAIFGEKEIDIIKKQLMGLPLTASEKTRLSRDIKRKLKSIKELSRYESEFELKKSQEINSIIDESKEIILENSNDVKEIILFGSYATNEQTKDSDVDIALKIKNSNISSTRLRALLMGKLNSKVDLHIYSDLPNKVKLEIDSKGKIIYKNE
ncbi:MAG: nucleotidyltransferase domain-containing protein [Nanoarchaeota archaeon]|nr:nucleotidyltransferase domain-containing protein [Nanoarchaeota archaeon]